MKNQINEILKNISKRVSPETKEIEEINTTLRNLKLKIEEKLKSNKINAEVFVGGSFAKGTMLRKDNYDVDVYLRFDQKYKDEISNTTEKLLSSIRKDYQRIKGSRDYFKIKINKKFYLEIIPVLKIDNPKESRNVTDLSYSHVKYVRKKLNKNMENEVRLAKEFCYAKKVYGAESYIKGFSGYVIELLIIHYGGFLKFIKEISKIKKGSQIIIDTEKLYKNKKEILLDINASKLQSPLIIIDPTYKYRNAAAALSNETFFKFVEDCKKFLKNPSENDFEEEKLDFKKIKEKAIKNKLEFTLLEIRTEKQEGDIAGTKLLKFFNHLEKEIEKLFIIKNKGFVYDEAKNAMIFFVAKNKNEIIFKGPELKQKENVTLFKKSHKNTFSKSGRIYAKEKNNLSLKGFIDKWKNRNSHKLNEMSIVELKEIN